MLEIDKWLSALASLTSCKESMPYAAIFVGIFCLRQVPMLSDDPIMKSYLVWLFVVMMMLGVLIVVLQLIQIGMNIVKSFFTPVAPPQ